MRKIRIAPPVVASIALHLPLLLWLCGSWGWYKAPSQPTDGLWPAELLLPAQPLLQKPAARAARAGKPASSSSAAAVRPAPAFLAVRPGRGSSLDGALSSLSAAQQVAVTRSPHGRYQRSLMVPFRPVRAAPPIKSQLAGMAAPQLSSPIGEANIISHDSPPMPRAENGATPLAVETVAVRAMVAPAPLSHAAAVGVAISGADSEGRGAGSREKSSNRVAVAGGAAVTSLPARPATAADLGAAKGPDSAQPVASEEAGTRARGATASVVTAVKEAAATELGGGEGDGPSVGARPRFQPYPEIPDWLLDDVARREVLVRFEITENGQASASIARTSGSAQVDELVLAACDRWRFAPALFKGRARASTLRLRVVIR